MPGHHAQATPLSPAGAAETETAANAVHARQAAAETMLMKKKF
jgi:hypothetical protein